MFTNAFDDADKLIAHRFDDEVLGGQVGDFLAAKARLEGCNSGVAMMWGVGRGDTEEIISCHAGGFCVADHLPLERVGAR